MKKLLYVDDTTPRIDGRNHEPTNMTVGKVYDLLEIQGPFFAVINDKGKRARYLQIRFKAVSRNLYRVYYNIGSHDYMGNPRSCEYSMDVLATEEEEAKSIVINCQIGNNYYLEDDLEEITDVCKISSEDDMTADEITDIEEEMVA